MRAERHELKSEQVGDSFAISIELCSLTEEVPTEVLVVTDAVWWFGAAVDIANALLLTERIPPLLVVGVGYPGASTLPETHTKRMRDLTPAAIDDHEGSGGATAFRDFLLDELSPWLEGLYGIGVVGGSLAGGSLGGLFGAWALLNEPAIFRRYCLSSPALWWDKGAIFDDEAAYAAAHEDLDARVYVGVGADECAASHLQVVHRVAEADRVKERKEAVGEHVDMVTGARILADALVDRQYPTLQLELQVHPGEDHATAGFVNLSRGLRYLFDRSGCTPGT